MSDGMSDGTGAGKIRVALADDQRLLREGLRIILEAAPDIEVVGVADDGVAACELAARDHPDVMLMDIRMPRKDGIAATETIRAVSPETRVILLTTYDTPELVVDGVRAGASGYLLKDASAEELCAAVRTVARGQVLFQAQSAAQLLASQLGAASILNQAATMPNGDDSGLTDRERDVLRLIAEGRANAEIAEALTVSEATVKTHINHIFAKLGARDRTQALVIARQRGLA